MLAEFLVLFLVLTFVNHNQNAALAIIYSEFNEFDIFNDSNLQ